ncbi:MAG TPA: hypothetical protein VKZ50_05060 [bacterium]|nr:hypothetical protein [bacterium]
MADTERVPIDSPGFLRSAEGGYIKYEDFLTFIAGAAPSKTGGTNARAMAWLRKQDVTGPIDHLSPADVSRLTAAAQKVIAAKHGRDRRVGPPVEARDHPAPPEPNDEEPTEG